MRTLSINFREINLTNPYSMKYERYKKAQVNTSTTVNIKSRFESNLFAKEYNSAKKIDKLRSRYVPPTTKQIRVNAGNALKKTNTSLKEKENDGKKTHYLNSALHEFNQLKKKTSEDPLAKSHEVHFELEKSKLDNSSASLSSNLSSEMERGTGMICFTTVDEMLCTEGIERAFKPYALQITKPAWNQQFRSLDLRPRNMM